MHILHDFMLFDSVNKMENMNKLKSFFQVIIVILICIVFVNCNADSFNDLLTHEERQWLEKNNGQITLSVETNYAPFVFIGKDGISQGLATEYIELIENRLNFKFKRVRAESLDEIFIKAKEKKIDVINAVTETPGRSKFLTFTKPFIEIPNVIIVRKEHSDTLTLEALKDMKVSLVKNYAVTEYIEKNYNNLNLDIVPDDLTALLHVSFDVTDSAIIDLATATYMIQSKGISNLHIAGEINYSAKLALASRRDIPLLSQILNKGISSISNKEIESIKHRWFSVDHINLFKSKDFWLFIVGVISIVLLGIIGFIVCNQKLKRQIEKQTALLITEFEEHRRVEKTMQANQEIHTSIIQTAMDAFCVINKEGQLIEVNNTYCLMIGYSEQELLKMSVQELEATDANHSLTDLLKKLTLVGADRFEARHKRKDGSVFDIELSIQ